MNTELKKDIHDVLEYFKAMGFERIPLTRQTAVDNASEPLLNFTLEGLADNSPRPPLNLRVGGETPEQSSPICSLPAGDKQAALQALREEIGDCRRCGLSHGRSNIVFGEGDPNARIMFIGEGPGREEDIQARPFVGDAGQLLTKLIEKMGFNRSDVFIANIVKCRPPMNRDPHDDEMRTCSPLLRKQVDIVSPEIIVSLGKIATFCLMGKSGPMSGFSIMRTRGKFFEYESCGRRIPVMPTFHPAYLLRNPKDKWLTWEDAQAVLRALEEKK
jgi:uracil-DNA glycosylase family 4